MGVSYGIALCSGSSTCESGTQQESFLHSVFNPAHGEINPCCGLFDNTPYYSLDGGSCLPCELLSQVHIAVYIQLNTIFNWLDVAPLVIATIA